VEGRTATRLGRHIAGCRGCAEEEQRARLVTDSLAAWEDVPAPEDAFHRLETRLAFLPAAAAPAPRPKGRLYTLAIPYFAGAASAAAIMLALLPVFQPEVPPPVTPQAPVAMNDAASIELQPGERELTFRGVNYVVDEHGNLFEVPAEVQEHLRKNSDQMPEGGRELGYPVNYER
jgi:hypothetical protein